jgi:nucleotide-binding universal stress UspA family protein
MFNKILVATAKPCECDHGVLVASGLARHNQAKLLILHVLESDSTIYRNYIKHFRTGAETVCDTTYQHEVREELQKNCSDETRSLKMVEVRIAVGIPWVEILKQAREENVDLIVLGAHTHHAGDIQKGGSGPTVGSTAEGVIRHERCPVMIVANPVAQSKLAFKKIMVSIDFSPSCLCAFRFAVDVAHTRKAALYLFHMLPVPPQPEYTQARYESEVRKIRQRLQIEFQKNIPASVEAEIETWGGTYPHVEILKCARRHDVDLIVMGSHTKIKGELEASRWYVGSAVEGVSSRSACPVVVITDPKALRKWTA